MRIIPGFALKAMSDRPFQLLDLCRKLPEGGFLWKPYPGVRSIRDVLVHMIGADRHWVEFVVEGKPRPQIDPDALASPDEVEHAFRPVREHTVAWMAGLDEQARTETRRIRWEPHEVTLEAIAWHLITHDFHHKGQVCTRLAMLGIEVPDLDII
ncbi:MAG: DinB family protein [Bacillota bacterium]